MGGTSKKRSTKKIVLWIVGVLFFVLAVAAVLLYFNFNRLLSISLQNSFNSNIISDVYELKFERLSVNFATGNIRVHNVVLKPREKPLQNYPYINSSFVLKADKILLGNVQVMTLLRSNKLKLDKIELAAPGIDFTIDDINPVFFPFNDTVKVAENTGQSKKKTIESFFLRDFNMIDASFQVANSAKKREFEIKQININLQDLKINQEPGKDIVSYKHVDLSIGNFNGNMHKESLKSIRFKHYQLSFDSLEVQHSYDTTLYSFANFSTSINGLDIQTADSIFHLTMEDFNLSYKDKSIKLQGLSFKPNISQTAMQSRFPYQHTQFSGTVGSLEMTGVNFDSLIRNRKIFIDQILFDSVSASIYKDNTKPVDKNKFPKYLGQTVKEIPIPLSIRHVKLTNVNLTNQEKKPDGSMGTANIRRGTVDVTHVSNISSRDMLTMKADAYVENKAHFNLTLLFNYQEPTFKFEAAIDKFNLNDLNPLIQSYTPANINKGMLDELTFSGTANNTSASGTMKFLFHDLDINLELKEKAKWKSSVLTFAANTALPSANPSSAEMPARIVQFQVDRIMNKSFVNLVIKSLLAGLKETMIMSKENKKTHKEEKKLAKKEQKEEKKRAKQEQKEEKKKAKQENKKS